MYFRALDHGPVRHRTIANAAASAILALIVFVPTLALGLRLLG